MNSLLEIIESIDSPNSKINPTDIYNEGWMTRLFVYYSIKDKLKVENIDYSTVSNWCAEAVISSPFQPRKRMDNMGEGFTHADMAIGDFKVDFSDNGEIKLMENAKLFGIIEAKMGSNLSQGTKNAPNYNQASRNLACISAKTAKTEECNTFFGVVAPEIKIKHHKLEEQLNKNFLLKQIRDRFEMYPKEYRQEKKMEAVLEKAMKTNVWCLSYEQWLEKFTNSDTIEELSTFYEKAKKWNKIK